MKKSLAHLPELKANELELIAEELKYLARCVELLRDQTKTSCNTKVETFT